MPYKKSKVVYLLLALFFGIFGFHHFYLGNNKRGIMYLIFCWTYIPLILAIRDMFAVGRIFDEYEKKCLCEEAANNFRMNGAQNTRAYRNEDFTNYKNVHYENVENVHYKNVKNVYYENVENVHYKNAKDTHCEDVNEETYKENCCDEKQKEKKDSLEQLVLQGQLSKDEYNFIKVLTPVERKFIGEFKHLKMDILSGSIFSNDQGVTALDLIDEINGKSSSVFQKKFIKLDDEGYSIYKNYRSLVELMDKNQYETINEV